jgi:cytochrome c oxidase subunit 3
MAEQHAIVAHQFDDLEQQHESDTLGMWAFLATEVMFFGGLIAAYIAYRSVYPEAWAEASSHTKFWFGTINTAVLLCSSLSMALSVDAAKRGNRKLLTGLLVVTAVLGAVFLGIKGYEYYLEYQEQLVPGLNFAMVGPHARPIALFFTFYFIMTGLHALHLTIGIGLILVMAYLGWRHRFSGEHYMPVELTGLYWHFVDIVWVFLYPLIYLVAHYR